MRSLVALVISLVSLNIVRASSVSPFSNNHKQVANGSSYQGDQLAQEQRLAVQIITTDGVGSLTGEGKSKDRQAHKNHLSKSSSPNGVISFDDQYEMLQSSLADGKDQKTKLQPKRIVINLSSLLENSTSEQQSGEPETKMIIGFSSEALQGPSNDAGQVSNRSSRRKLEKQASEGGASRLSVPEAKSMRNAVMEAIRRQGGVPTMVVDGREVGESQRPKFKFMIQAQQDRPDEASSTRESMSMAAARNEASLRQEVDSLSNEVEPVESASREDDESLRSDNGGEQYASAEFQGQASGEGEQRSQDYEQRMEPRKYYYDGSPAHSSKTELDRGGEINFARSRAYNEASLYNADDNERADSSRPEQFSISESDQRRHHPANRESRSHDKLPDKEAPQLYSAGSDEKKMSGKRSRNLLSMSSHNSNSLARAGQSLQQDAGKQSGSSSAGSRTAKASQQQSTRESKQAKQQQQQQQQQEQQQQSPESSRMDDRVARILDRLKLYTTKEQLMKVARDLEAYPSRPSLEDQAGMLSSEREKSTSQMSRVQTSHRPRHLERSTAESSSVGHSRNKVPAPVVARELADLEPADSERPDAVDELDRPSSGEEKPGEELLDRYRARQSRMREMLDEQDPEQNQSRAASAEDESGSSSKVEPHQEQDDDVRDYTNNQDIVDVMQTNERAYESEESQNQNSFENSPHVAAGETSGQDSAPAVGEESNERNEEEVRAIEQVVDELAARQKQSDGTRA